MRKLNSKTIALVFTLLSLLFAPALAMAERLNPVSPPVDSNIEHFNCTSQNEIFASRLEPEGTRFYQLSAPHQPTWIATGLSLPYLAFHQPLAWGFRRSGKSTELIQYDLRTRNAQRTLFVVLAQESIPGAYRFTARKIEQGKELPPHQYLIDLSSGELRELPLAAELPPVTDSRLPHLISNTWQHEPEGPSLPITQISLAFGLEQLTMRTEDFVKTFSFPDFFYDRVNANLPTVETVASCGPTGNEFILAFYFFGPAKQVLYRVSLADLLNDIELKGLSNEKLLPLVLAGTTQSAWRAASLLQKREIEEATWQQLLAKLEEPPPMKRPLSETIDRLGNDFPSVRDAASAEIKRYAETGGIRWIENTLLKELNRSTKNHDLEISLRSKRAISEILQLYSIGRTGPNDSQLTARMAFVKRLPMQSAWAETVVHDFEKINEQLGLLVNQSIASDEYLKMSRGEFDVTFSSIAKKRLRHSRNFELKSPPWNEAETTLIATQNSFWVDTGAPLPMINMSQRVTIKTDVLALVRYAAKLVRQKNYLKKLEPQDLVNRTLDHYTNVATLPEFHNRLNADRATALSVIDHRIKELKQPLPNDDADDAELLERHRVHSLEDQRILRSAVSEISFEGEFEKNELKRVRCDHLEGTKLLPEVRKQARVDRADVIFDERGIHIDIDGSYRPESRPYLELVDKLETLGKEIETKVPETSDDILKAFRDGLKSFRDVIRGENRN